MKEEQHLIDSMHVEQAIFGSSNRGAMKGYHLLGQSSGLTKTMCSEISRWCPTKMASDNPKDWTFNTYPVDENFIAVTRSVLGGPEYSNRGGVQVVTLILIVRKEQLAHYEFNTIEFAKMALAMGHLKLPWDTVEGHLPQIAFPQESILPIREDVDEVNSCGLDDQTLEEMAGMVEDSRRFVAIGCPNPIEIVNALIQKIPFDQRVHFSYTTGLPHSTRRPFQMQFLSSPETSVIRKLESQQITCVQPNKRLQIV